MEITLGGPPADNLDYTFANQCLAAKPQKADLSPLGQLGLRLQSDVTEDVPSPRGVLRCDVPEVVQARTSRESRDALPEQDRPPAPAVQAKKPTGAGFSLLNWQAKLSERCALQKRPAAAPPVPGATAAAAAVLGVAAARGPEMQRKAPAVSVGGFASHAREGLSREAVEFEFLADHFRNRDAGRMQRTVVPIASLMRTGDERKSKELLGLARDGLLCLAREGWSLLQERHPEAEPGLGVPSLDQPVDAEQHAARPSRCPTYLLPRHTSSSMRSGGASGSSGLPFKPPTRRPWKSEFGSENTDLESCGGDTPSTMDCSQRASMESVWSAPGAPHNSRLVTVESIDDELGLLGQTWPSWPSDDDGLPAAAATYGHRDDWELQYMLSGALDEVFERLAHPDANSDLTVNAAASVLEKARERVLEWTVKRWQTCCEEPMANRQTW